MKFTCHQHDITGAFTSHFQCRSRITRREHYFTQLEAHNASIVGRSPTFAYMYTYNIYIIWNVLYENGSCGLYFIT